MEGKRTTVQPLFAILICAVVLFAFLFNYPCGFRNLYRTDSSIFFDAGYRILQGELLFRDFYSPFVPYLYWLQAGFFKVLGVNYFAYVTLASFINAGSVAMAMLITKRLYRNHWAILLAGLVTSIWFTPIHKGTPWYGPGAFFLVLVALWLLLDKRFRPLWSVGLGGLLITLSFLTKQPIGAGAGLFIWLYLLQTGSVKRAFGLAGSFLLSFFIILAVFVYWGSWETVWRYLFLLPFTSSSHASVLSLTFMGLCFASLVAVIFIFKRQEWWLSIPIALFFALSLITDPDKPGQLGSVFYFCPLIFLIILQSPRDRALLMAMVLMQYMSGRFSEGSLFHHWPFLGILLAIVWKGLHQYEVTESKTGLLSLLPALDSSKINLLMGGVSSFVIYMGVRASLLKQISGPWGWIPVFWPAVCVAGIAGAYVFAKHAHRRRLWQPTGIAVLFVVVAIYGSYLSVRSFQTVFFNEEKPWLNPRNQLFAVDVEKFNGAHFSRADVKMLGPVIDYLKNLPTERKPFVVFPHFTLIHAILDERHSHPFLFFSRNLTYRSGELEVERLCHALQSRGIQTIALVKGEGSMEVLGDFPCLNTWVSKEFTLDKEIEEFSFYKLKNN